MELSETEIEILRKYIPRLKQYGVTLDSEICNLIENCNDNLEARLQAFVGWFLGLEHRALLEDKRLVLPNANEILFRALQEEWFPTNFQTERLIEASLFPLDVAIRQKLAEINFFQAITWDIPRDSNRIKFFYRGAIVFDEQISELLKVSNRGLIEMYKYRVRQHRENLKQLGLTS